MNYLRKKDFMLSYIILSFKNSFRNLKAFLFTQYYNICYNISRYSIGDDKLPKTKKITKENILDCALKIIKEKGMEGLNVRLIAKRLNCSIQPIYYQFSNFEDLKEQAYKHIYEIYQNMMISNIGKVHGYKEMGLAYIHFASMYPEYFKLIFMQQTDLDAEKFIMADHSGSKVLLEGMKLTNLSKEEQKKFHIKVWIFTHGIATLVATGTIKISDYEINKLLEDTVRELLIGFKKGNNNEKNN